MKRIFDSPVTSLLGLVLGASATAGMAFEKPTTQTPVEQSPSMTVRCDPGTLVFVNGQQLDGTLVDDVALWNVLDWGTCASGHLPLSAGLYHFTEVSEGYASLRTYVMTADPCDERPCKSGYRYNVRVRTNLDIDHEERTIVGETMVYFLRPTLARDTTPFDMALGYDPEVVYAGRVTFSAELPWPYMESVYSADVYDAGGRVALEWGPDHVLFGHSFCDEIADDLDTEIQQRIAGDLNPLEQYHESFAVVGVLAQGNDTTTELDAGELIEASGYVAAKSIDSVVRGHIAFWACEPPDPGLNGGGTVGGGTGTVLVP